MEASSNVTIRHPNREKAESKATKAIVVLLLLASAGLVAIITFGGWSALQGAQFVAIAAILIYVLMAYYVARWNRGVLPVASALAILIAVLAAIAAPAWFNRDKAGFHNPALPPSFLGTLCIVLVPVSLFLIAFAMRGFTQEWHVEVEEGAPPDGGGARRPQAA
jgi:presenilin-like A22 family membrane protease